LVAGDILTGHSAVIRWRSVLTSGRKVASGSTATFSKHTASSASIGKVWELALLSVGSVVIAKVTAIRDIGVGAVIL